MRIAGLILLLGALAAGQERPSSVPDPEAMLKRIALAPGLKAELWAKEPLLQNPVAIAFDEQGRLYAAECHRRHTSTLDIHMRKEWLDDDLACRRHEDLEAYHKKRLGERAKEWMVESERIRLLTDTDGDGRPDQATTFSEGYNGLGEGIGAGVLVRKGEVWYTCIPNLWHLKDTDGDGKADARKALFTGFGVHLGASGHDMHGLRFGPDGKLYWSHGDRGFRVETGGKVHDFPDGGGVFRCNPDGTEFEVVCVGLRNPQELAFDQHGNLFTGDNNISIAPDVGETCRWTYVVEGADYGWRIGYQFMPTGGAWCAEDQWRFETAFQVPFVARLGHGPSGVTYHPGVAAIPERYRDHFFMCDYPGGVYAFRMKPKGASFEMVDLEKLAWNMSAPDVEFGNDGALYVADWVGLWDKVDKGRVWRLADPEAKDPLLVEVKRLISEGMGKREVKELATLLGHSDQRIRQAAQFELVDRKEGDVFERGLSPNRPPLARLHAIWGLGQLKKWEPLLLMLRDDDAEVRTQAAKVLGELRAREAAPDLKSLMTDENPRVRYFATIGFGKTGRKSDRREFQPIIAMLQENGDRDRLLRHAGIMALTCLATSDQLAAQNRNASRAVRIASLVALRKLADPKAALFLEDEDPAIVLEAARAIYDQPIDAALPALADLLGRPQAPERALLRAVNAASRLGWSEKLAAFAGSAAPAAARVEALRVLADWEKPSGRDRLMGIWRPIAPRDRAEAVKAVSPRIPLLLKDGAPEIVVEAAKLAGALQVEGVGSTLGETLRDRKGAGSARAGALRALAELRDASFPESVKYALGEDDETLLVEGLRLLPKAGLPEAAERLEKMALSDAPVSARQAAIAGLGALKADAALARIGERGVPAALELEYNEATRKRGGTDRELLEGGDAAAGRRIFFERGEVQCVRCHKVGEAGGEVGPSLAAIGGQKTREYLLEALLLPNKTIAEGWGQVTVQLENGDVEVGRVAEEKGSVLTLVLADGQKKTIPAKQIKARKAGLSAMPEDLAKSLTRRELRDLVEFLARLR